MSNEDNATPKKPGVVRRAAGKVAGHVKAKREFRLPTWVIYIVGVLGLIGVVYGCVQQARIWRWEKILTAAQIRIAELEAEKKQVEFKVTKKIATGQIKVSKAKVKDLDKEIRKIDKEKAQIKKDSARMDGVSLRNAFRGEGFKKRSWQK